VIVLRGSPKLSAHGDISFDSLIPRLIFAFWGLPLLSAFPLFLGSLISTIFAEGKGCPSIFIGFVGFLNLILPCSMDDWICWRKVLHPLVS
jgi:hypothetical protein